MMVAVLRKLGFSVSVTSGLGKGFPDLAVGRNGVNVLVEVKDPAKPPSARKLTEDEYEWHQNWRGLVIVAETVDDVEAAFRKVTQYGKTT
jgi:Holliday junction resolvase